MDSQIKVIEMSRREMGLLKTSAFMGSLLSAIIASISVGILSLSSLGRPAVESGTLPTALPRWLIISEIAFGTAVLLISLTALGSRVVRSHEPPLDEDEVEVLIRLQRATTWPLLAAVFLSLPFRSVAELTGSQRLPNMFLLFCADIMNAFGISIVLFYLWMYPFSCGQSRDPIHDDDMDVEPRKLPVLQLCVCTLYALLRIITSFGLKVHLKPLPLQNLFALLALVIQHSWDDVSIWDTLSIAGISAIEFLILLGVLRDQRIYSKLLMSTVDISSHQIVIALRHFQQSAALLLFNFIFVDLVSALASPDQGEYVFQQTGDFVLSQPIGHSAVSTAVTAFALREFYVHHSWKDSGIVSGMWGMISACLPGHSPTRQNDLVYRVSDERNPLTEFPVPQKNTFSLETATLLFNMAWLATTYSGGETEHRVPNDFGRPAYSVHSTVAHRDGEVGAIILHSMDRIIVAFKPVSMEDLKHSYLLPLSQTFLGRALAGKCMELEVLNVRGLSPKDARLLRRSKVHAGFETVYSSVQGQILRDISDLLQRKQRPIYVTGYGSGGAVASLCILDLNFRRFIDQTRNSIYTFGAMKLMNSAMVQLFENLVPYRWRCVVSGDSASVRPISSSFKHPSKVATFTRNGHLTIEYIRACKWWQSPVSVHPMHKLSAYFCALENWHSAFHIKRPIDLWDWPVDSTIKALFKEEALFSDSRWPIDSALDSPTPDIESKSVRKLDSYFAASTDSAADDVVAFSR